MIYSEEKTYSP